MKRNNKPKTTDVIKGKPAAPRKKKKKARPYRGGMVTRG